MPEVAFVMSPGQSLRLRELAEVVGYELGLQGVPSTVHTEIPEPRPGLVYVMVGLREFLELEGEEGLPDATILGRTVMLGAEPARKAADGQRYRWLLGHFGAVFDTSVRSVLELHRAGIPARTLRPGYSQLRDHFDPDANRDIDVLFYGAADARRRRLLADYGQVLSRYNCLIQLSDPTVPNTGIGPSYLGAERYPLLARSKVAINLHQQDELSLEWSRVIDAMHCGAVVVSEHATGLAPFEPGRHLMVSRPEALAYVVEHLLNDRDRQQQLRLDAYERLSHWLPYSLSIGVLRAALVELVGRPIPAGVRRPRLKGRAGKPVRWTEPEPEPAPQQEEAEPIILALKQQLADTRAAGRREVAELQTGLAQVRRSLRSLHRGQLWAAGTPELEIHESAAWSAARGSRVGIVLAVGDDGPAVRGSLTALGRSRSRDFDLVIAGASGAGLEEALAWSRRNPRTRVRVLELAVEGGEGELRNLAVEHLRGQYCLVIRPGDRLYPRCVEVLSGTLDALVQVTAVYPITQVPRPADDELSGYCGWSPERLAAGPIFAAPYMIRRRALAGLGGFATAAELADWEDYDLLCRMADSGAAVQLVPQVLAVGAAPAAELRIDGSHRAQLLVSRSPRLLAGLSVG